MKRLIALLGVSTLLTFFAAPAQAAPSPSLTLTAVGGSPSCVASGQTVTFEMVGRNLDPTRTYSGSATDSASNVWLPPTAPRSPSIGNQWGQRFSYTGDGTSTVLTASLMSADPTLTATFNIVACGGPAPTPGPAPTSIEEPPPPPPLQVHQGLPMPEAGCEAVKDEEFAWGTGLTGGWVKSWQTWRREDGTVFHDGYACIRSMEHIDGAWRLIEPI